MLTCDPGKVTFAKFNSANPGAVHGLSVLQVQSLLQVSTFFVGPLMILMQYSPRQFLHLDAHQEASSPRRLCQGHGNQDFPYRCAVQWVMVSAYQPDASTWF
jgi:hypothetical protein